MLPLACIGLLSAVRVSTEAPVGNKFERTFQMRSDGMTLKQIAGVEGVTHQAILYRLRRYRERLTLVRICALVECDIQFETTNPCRFYCCDLHSKRGTERQRLGRTAELIKCRLPECKKMLLRVGDGDRARRFCCKTHSSRHLNRIKIGYYDKLVDRTACFVCGFWGPGLDQHHLVRRVDGGTDDPSNLIWLCSNHHRMLHSNLAHFEDGIFVDTREEMRASEVLSREDWGELCG